MHYCKSSEIFCHYFLWNILSEKENHVGTNHNLPEILSEMERSIVETMNLKERRNY